MLLLEFDKQLHANYSTQMIGMANAIYQNIAK